MTTATSEPMMTTATGQATSPGDARADGDPPRGAKPRERTGSYGAILAAYGLSVGGFLAALRTSGRELPEKIGVGDLALAAVATHKTSRLLAKDKVATPIRAPFTEYRGESGPSEVSDAPRGTGLRRSLGELLACPFCLDVWVATGYVAGIVAAPRHTRFAATVMNAVAIADFLQIAYKAGEERL